MKYLVTGGAGFIGSNIVEELLRRGENVRILDNFATGKRENIADIKAMLEKEGKGEHFDKLEVVEGDIRGYHIVRDAVDGVDFILHQAALPSVPRSVKDPLTTNEVNVVGTLNVLNAAKDCWVKNCLCIVLFGLWRSGGAAQTAFALCGLQIVRRKILPGFYPTLRTGNHYPALFQCVRHQARPHIPIFCGDTQIYQYHEKWRGAGYLRRW